MRVWLHCKSGRNISFCSQNAHMHLRRRQGVSSHIKKSLSFSSPHNWKYLLKQLEFIYTYLVKINMWLWFKGKNPQILRLRGIIWKEPFLFTRVFSPVLVQIGNNLPPRDLSGLCCVCLFVDKVRNSYSGLDHWLGRLLPLITAL